MSGTHVVEAPPRAAAVVRALVTPADMPRAQREARAALRAAFAAAGLASAGPALTVWRPPSAAGTIDYAPGVLLPEGTEPPLGLDAMALPGGRLAHLRHEGGYEGLGTAWGRLFADCAAQGLVPAGLNWEVYAPEGGPPGADLYCALEPAGRPAA